MFEAGKKYVMRFVTDADLSVIVEIISRTEKTIKFKLREKIKSAKIHNFGDGEFFYPTGKYSMSPIIRAESDLSK